jgi:hypothetical protein
MGGLGILENRKQSIVLDSDEIAWIFAGYYFNLYFLHHDIIHSDWNDDEAFDHPPLAKYVVGGILYLKGYTIDSLEAKRFWNNIPINQFPQYIDLIKHKIPNPTLVIPFTRSIIYMFAISSLFLIYIFVRIRYGVLPAIGSVLLIIINPIFYTVSVWILAEPLLLFFYSLFILLCVLYLKYSKNLYVILALIVSALGFITKINGILLVFLFLTIFLIKNRLWIVKQDYKYLIAGFIAFLFIVILLNPVFLNSGLSAIGRMIEARLAAFSRYQETFKNVALLSVKERFITATQMIFFEYSFFYHWLKTPVELILFILGICYFIKKKDLFFISILIYLVIIPLSVLPYNIIKYYYWIFPFTHITAGVSLNLVIEAWMGRKTGNIKKKVDGVCRMN